MNFISLNNFKSYGTQIVANLNPKINIIMGKNGEGKSNFLKAINFVFTDRVALNKTQYNSYLHKVFDNTPENIAVQIYFKQNRNGDQNLYRIQRIWKPDITEEMKVQNTVMNRNIFQTFIQTLGLSFTNPYNIVQQGKITMVTLMDQYEVFKLLEQATGIKKYEIRHNEAVNNMKKTLEQKQIIQKFLKELDEKMRVFQSKKQEFQYINYQQLAFKVKSKQHYQQRLSSLTKQLGSLKIDDVDKSDNVNRIKIQQKEIENQLEDVNEEIQIAKKQLIQYVDQPFQDDQLQVNQKFIEKSQKKYKIEVNKIQKQKQKLKNKLVSKHKQVEKLRQQLQPYKQKYRVLTLDIQALKITKQNKQKTKSDLNDIILREKANIKQLDNELKKINKYKSQFKHLDNKKQAEEINKIKQKLNQLNNEIKVNKIKLYECNRHKNQLQSECNVLTSHTDSYYMKMRKLLPLLEFKVLNQIRKQKIKGVYGFFIQFLEIQPNIAFAYEIASLSKLCTLLVQDEQACNNVVEVNRRIKGKQISILPLKFVKNQVNEKKNYPKMQDCYSLLNQQWIKIKQHPHGPQFTKVLKKIISNTFNKHLLVKDYDTGLKISKEYHLHCITADKQIIFSEGYLCKLGKDQNVDDRVEIYYKYAQKVHQLEQCRVKLSQVFKQSTALQNVELELIKKKLIIDNDLRRLQQKAQEINDQKRAFNKLEQEQGQLLKKRKKSEQQIKQKQELLSKIDAKKSSVNQAQYKQLQQFYKTKLDAFNKRCEQQYLVEQQYELLNKKSQELKNEMTQNHLNKSFQEEFKVQFVSNRQYKERLGKKQDELEKKRTELLQKCRKLKNKQEEIQKNNYNIFNQINTIQQEIVFYEKQLQKIGNVEESIEEIQEKSNSFSVSFMRMHQERKKKINTFTTKQKLLLSKIGSFREEMDALMKEYHSIEEVEKKTNQLIGEYEKEKDAYLGQMFKTFQKEFAKIFKFMTGNGKVDIRLKKNSEKVKGLVKYRNSVSIFVSFERQRETTNWSGLSGGQKTVIAFCLLAALQKCQPAPFYIFDQIDSALDPIYLDRIVHYIKQQCNQSQYFITSFKKEMMQFPQDICNYYYVTMNDRLSKVQRISKNKAQQLVPQLAS